MPFRRVAEPAASAWAARGPLADASDHEPERSRPGLALSGTKGSPSGMRKSRPGRARSGYEMA